MAGPDDRHQDAGAHHFCLQWSSRDKGGFGLSSLARR
jgi:hypothetical protein